MVGGSLEYGRIVRQERMEESCVRSIRKNRKNTRKVGTDQGKEEEGPRKDAEL
eukprot:COSAG02_NODE_7985_length_2757_cov_2.605342_3_plen_53_part_00